VTENSLHTALKRWYARPGDQLEARVGGYVVDIVRGDLLIEIQTGNFSSIKGKLASLAGMRPVRLVHPIPERKWIVRLAGDGETVLSRRRSPKRGRVEDLFDELVRIPGLVSNPRVSLEALLVHSEEVLIDDGRGSWRRRRWSVHDRRLLDVVGSRVFEHPRDFLALMPFGQGEEFTARDLAVSLGIRPRLAWRMAYCLRHMEVIRGIGKKGRANLYVTADI